MCLLSIITYERLNYSLPAYGERYQYVRAPLVRCLRAVPWLQVGCAGKPADDKAAHQRRSVHGLDPAGALRPQHLAQLVHVLQRSTGCQEQLSELMGVPGR